MVTVSMLSIAIVITLPLIYLATITLNHLYHTALVQRSVMAIKTIWGKCKGREVRDSTEENGN